MGRLMEKNDEHYIARQDRVNGKIIGNQMCLDKLGELEDAEEQGLLLRLPCKVGDTVYRYCEYNGNVMEYEILNIHISSYASGGYDIAIEGVTEDDEGEEYEFCLSVTEFKKECFASHEEAESALAEKGVE